MVRFEDNSLLYFYHYRVLCVSHISLWATWRFSVWRPCLSTTKFAGGRVIKPRDGLRRGSYQGDGRRGKVWSRGGQDDEMSLSDTGWLRLESKRPLVSGPTSISGRPKSSPSGQVFADNVPDIKEALYSEFIYLLTKFDLVRILTIISRRRKTR